MFWFELMLFDVVIGDGKPLEAQILASNVVCFVKCLVTILLAVSFRFVCSFNMPRVSDRQKQLRLVKQNLEFNIALQSSSSDSDVDSINNTVGSLESIEITNFSSDTEENTFPLDSSSETKGSWRLTQLICLSYILSCTIHGILCLFMLQPSPMNLQHNFFMICLTGCFFNSKE